jgi:N-hydroxyarylamine O-acetyltransferase
MPFGSEFVLEAQLGDVWDSLYRFVIEPAPLVDFQMSNWFTSTFPSSTFRNNLIVARPTATGRTTVFNRRFTTRDRDNRTTRRVLESVADYRNVLVGEFDLMLSDVDISAVAEAMASHTSDEAVHPAFV